MNFAYLLASPLGDLRLVSNGTELIGLYFEGHRPAPRLSIGRIDRGPFRSLIEQLDDYFAGCRDAFDVPSLAVGTEFQQAVWAQLPRIPFGETTTYAAIGRAIGRGRAVRAVGAAVARNPISIINPCHRVVGSHGSLTGFAGGIERKRWLLRHEGTPDDRFTSPVALGSVGLVGRAGRARLAVM